ncbi:Protein-L-isoaspartate O-methyltransferase [compost metagenome]
MVTAAPPAVPEKLVEQLAPGGRLVIPVGESYQELLLLQKTEDGLVEKRLLPVRFVPMVPEASAV